MEMFNVTEQRLVNQKNGILKATGFRTGRNSKKH